MKRLFLYTACVTLLASCKLIERNPPLDNPITYSVGTGVSMTESHLILTGRIEIPPFEKGGPGRPHIITTTGEQIDTAWVARSRESDQPTQHHGSEDASMEQRKKLWTKALSRIRLDPRQTYRIELLKQIYTDTRLSHPMITDSTELLRVSRDNQVLIDASICELHHTAMQRVIMDATSAEDYPEAFYNLRKKEFPNDACDYLSCGSGNRDPGWKCPECARKCVAWEKKHGVNTY